MVVSISSHEKTTKNTTNGGNFETKCKHTISKKDQLNTSVIKEQSDSKNEEETPQFDVEEKLAPLQMIEDDKILDQEIDFDDSKKLYPQQEKPLHHKTQLKVDTFPVQRDTETLSPGLKESSPTNSSKHSKPKKLSSTGSPSLLQSTKLAERKRSPSTHEILRTEEAKTDLLSHKDTFAKKSIRKPSEQYTSSKGLLNEGNSIVTANHSSDMVTAHFNSTRLKSVTTNESPALEKDIEQIRDLHEDPISFLTPCEVLLT